MVADAKAVARYKAQAQVLKALAHPSRLLMVEELSKGERCVCELAAQVGAQMATVSRHLSQLRHAGIVEDDKRGAQVFYRLITPCVMNFFQCVASVREESRVCLSAPASRKDAAPLRGARARTTTCWWMFSDNGLGKRGVFLPR